MKLVVVGVAAAVAAVTGLTIAIGALVHEDTVVARPYEEGLRYGAQPRAAGCDLGAAPCTRVIDDLELTAELGPRPLAPMRPLRLAVAIHRAGAPVDGAEVRVSFSMAGMEMGENAVALAAEGGGRWAGTAVLVRCPSGRRDWIAAVEIRAAGAVRRTELPLRVGE